MKKYITGLLFGGCLVYGQTAINSLQGNGAKIQLSTGSTVSGDCVKFDVNGNTVDNGAACGSPGGGTVNSVTATAPLSSTGGTTPVISIATPQGNGNKVQLSTGATTLNDCVKYDNNGNTVDAGAACGAGGGGAAIPYGTVTDGTPINWDLTTSAVKNGTVTLNHTTPTRFLNVQNLANGGFYTLEVKQDSTGGANMLLGSGGGITFDTAATSTGQGATTTTYSWSHTVGAGTNTILLVWTALAANANVHGVTYNGVAMTGSVAVGFERLWYLIAPATGTHTVTVSQAADYGYGASLSFTGVDQISPIDNTATDTTAGCTTCTVSITPVNPNAFVAQAIVIGIAATLTSPSWTQGTNSVDPVNNDSLATSWKGPVTGSQTSSWNVSAPITDQNVAVSLKPAGSAGACVWTVSGGGNGSITLTTAANAVDILSFTYDGAGCRANLQSNFN